MRQLVLTLGLMLPMLPVTSQDVTPPRQGDVATIDGIVAAVYESISGPAGAPRDWARFRTLFTPDARMMPTGRRPDGTGVRRVWSIEEYITAAGPQLTEGGFFEREVQPLRAVAGLARASFAGRLVVARALAGPGRQMAR